MTNHKQILIIDNLGITQLDFEKIAKKSGLNFEIIQGENNASSEEVEIIITVNKEVNAELLDKFPNVKMVAVAFTGFDSVDLDVCRQKNIAVYNVPAYATNSVVELTLGLIISLLREIPRANELIRNQGWEMKPGLELSGRKVGIVGTGKIGIAVAKVFKVLGCELIGWSRTENEEFKSLGGKYIADKQTFFASADIVSVHLPLNQHTRGIIGKDEFDAMKKTSFLINTARGPIVDEKALIEALQNKEIAGAGLDVFAHEPIHDDNKLLEMENVVLTPHVAYKTQEAISQRALVTAQNILNFLNEDDTNRVDRE